MEKLCQTFVQVKIRESIHVIINYRAQLQANFRLVCPSSCCVSQPASQEHVASLDNSFLTQKCFSTQQANLVSESPVKPKRHGEPATKQLQVFQINPTPYSCSHTHRHANMDELLFLPWRSLEVLTFFFLFFLFFWWRYKSERWKAYLMFMVVPGWTAFTVQRQY